MVGTSSTGFPLTLAITIVNFSPFVGKNLWLKSAEKFVAQEVCESDSSLSVFSAKMSRGQGKIQ